ncbi:MAG: RNA polymerase sigma factor [Clostridiales Family XIII bacterium]|jgi:RNA polymerase sigma-70 factor (ECF subfamily)|nr:RNA polymerase sigma factor [Clostridiales Family XIII bacterium]
MQTLSNVELAKKAIRGDEGAFEALIRAKQRRILFCAMTILKNESDAEDAAQEAILKIYRSIGKLKNPEAVSAWMDRIVRNESYNLFNRRHPENLDVDIYGEEIVIEEETREFLPEAYVEDSELNSELYETILSLAPAKREAILLYYYEGLSYKEIARVTSSNEKSVSANLSRARAELKKRLLGGDMMKSIAGTSATQEVIGRALEARSVALLPNEKLAGFEQKWLPAVKAAPKPTKPIVKNAVISVCVTVFVFLGLVYGIASFGGASSTSVSAPAETGRQIALVSNDCDCGHVNPQSAEIVNAIDGDGDEVWSILSEVDGSVIFSGGDVSAVSAELQKLSEEHRDGDYLIKATLKDKNGNKVELERPFTIGEFKTPVA